jgi:hypothetical protein
MALRLGRNAAEPQLGTAELLLGIDPGSFGEGRKSSFPCLSANAVSFLGGAERELSGTGKATVEKSHP